MKIIIPMAGRGKRMRPHTLTVPKPLFPLSGKSIVQRLVETLVRMCDKPVTEVAYVIGDFGKETEDLLKSVTADIQHVNNGNKPIKPTIYYQDKPLGTAHAILCAAPMLEGNVIIGFADTLFKADFKLDIKKDGIIYTHQVEDPTSFGVVKVDEKKYITDFVEKPKEPISNLAIIGIYYIREGETLRQELQYLIDNDIKDKGEYQITNALENMKNKGARFAPGKVEEWLDCGNKDATVFTNQRVLEQLKETDEKLVSDAAKMINSKIIEPCYIGPDVTIRNAVIGPHVSVEKGTIIENSRVENSIVLSDTHINYACLRNSIIGNNVAYMGSPQELSLGDYTTFND